ncbi:hypothetical protein APSETT444_008473 [Aspergillus pseudonomiae]
MVQYWKDEHTRSSSQSEFILTDAREDILKFTLNIICSVGYGVKLPFKPILENSTDSAEGLFKDAISPSPGYHFTFRSAMEYLNKHITSIFIANGLPKCIPRSILPFFKKDFDAFDDIGSYLRALVSMAETKESLTQNLIDGLVRSKQQRNKGQGLDPDLTDDEILGNLFVFTIAGHETTAVALRFALVLLALNQDAQEYLYEGIREATCDEPHNPVEWDYRRVYPKLVSPLCVMLETLRMYPPVTTIPRWTGDSAVDITYQNQSYLLPPHVYISVNASGLHYSEEYWGPDAAVYDPKRWDKQNTESFLAKNEGVGLSGPGLEYDTIHKPVRGSYIPFSDGFRVCLGKKFAQVEFVVAVAIIFREYHVVLAKSSECKTEDDMRRRAEKVLQESTSFITLSMRDEVPLLFQKRGYVYYTLNESIHLGQPIQFDAADSITPPASIPRIIHRTYKTEDIPSHWKGTYESCRTLNPTYKQYFWTDESSRQFIETHFDWFLPTYDAYPYNIQRADAIRYFLLWHYGGVYIDMDIACRRPLDPLLDFSAWMPKTQPYGVSNDLMASTPGHPFITKVALALHDHDGFYLSKYITVFFTTGPMYLSSLLTEWFRKVQNGPGEEITMPHGVAILPSMMYDTTAYSFFGHAPGSTWHGNDVAIIPGDLQ